MKTKEELAKEQEGAEGAKPTTTPTPEQLAQEETDKMAALAALGLKAEDLDNVKGYKDRKKEVEAGFTKKFQQEQAALKKQREELEAREKELLARKPEDAPDRKKAVNDIQAKFKMGEIDDEEMADQLDKVYQQKATTQPSKSVEQAVKDAFQEFRQEQEMKDSETASKQEAAINRIAIKLAQKHDCDTDYASAIFETALNKTGDPVRAIEEASKLLARFEPKKPVESQDTKQPMIPLKPSGPKHNHAGTTSQSELIHEIAGKMGG